MEKNPLLSVIVPVYNVEAYLRQCLDSILFQDYPNLEVIVIDDGSTDTSGTICDEYGSRYSNVVVIHKQNGGLSSARNAGLKVCNGEYISFIDSDDYIQEGMYTTMMGVIRNYSLCVVSCAYKHIYNDGTRDCDIKFTNKTRVLTTPKDILQNISIIAIQVWNKLYHKSVLSGFVFTEGATFEDIPLSLHIIKTIDSIAIVDTPYYCYRVAREGSTVSSFKDSRLLGYGFFPDYINYVVSKYGTDFIQPLAKIASEFFIQQYYECDLYRHDENIKTDIYRRFESVNKYVSFKEHRIYSKIFCISPKLFLIIKKLRNLFR